MKIAIVEDELKLAKTLKEGLEGEGYSVDIFGDAESLERQFRDEGKNYSLFIIDIMLPKKNGIELCKDLRISGSVVPVLILTARSAIEDKVLGLDAGADDYLTKPFAFEELLARVRALVRRFERDSLKKITIQDLVIDAELREATRSGKLVPLTPKEFDLLWFLVERRKSCVTREELSTFLWESRDPSLSNVVDVHISNLRKKIDETHGKKIIRTVRGAGYTIQA